MKEKELIRKTLSKFFKGFDELDEDLVRQAFAPDATLYAYNEQQQLTRVEFHDWVKMISLIKSIPDHPYSKERSQKTVLSIDVEGKVAQAKVEWKFSKFKMIDYYQLIKEEERWMIVNKIWHTDIIKFE